MKSVEHLLEAPPRHWVGDGFPVRSLFSYHANGQAISPFLLLDYAAPMEFEPSGRPRGVGSHPHRGFETVTIVYDGEVTHRDSSGGGGTIRPGDVQWMTAGAGLVHDEFHSESFTRSGGRMEMVQLWVNLPAKSKMTPPRYQSLARDDIPVVPLDGGGQLRVIAGEYAGLRGPAETHTPVYVWDARLPAGSRFVAPVADGLRLIVVVLEGSVDVDGAENVGEATAILFSTDGDDAVIDATSDSRLLVLAGAPIDEPIAGYGPFVMNTEQEIRDAITDFARGRFGALPAEGIASSP